MPTQNPPVLDSTMKTTESTPRNLADVLASGLSSIANNVKPDAADIPLAPITGMSADDVQEGISELKSSLVNLENKFVFNPTAFSGDCDDIKTPSCYFVTSSASNRPASGFWRLITLTFAGAPTQIAISNDLTSIYLRNFTNGAWTGWSQM